MSQLIQCDNCKTKWETPRFDHCPKCDLRKTSREYLQIDLYQALANCRDHLSREDYMSILNHLEPTVRVQKAMNDTDDAYDVYNKLLRNQR